MSTAESLFGLVKRSLLLADRVERLAMAVGDLGKEVREHDRRLIRIETMVEVGLRRAGPPRLTDE